MRLAEAKKLRLDDDVGRWLPGFAGRGLSLRHLLTHRSGFRDAIFPVESDDPTRVGAYLKILAAQPAARPPGAAYAYTDADYNVLGAVVAAASGQLYARYVQAEIIERLKCPDADIFPAPAARDAIAPPFLNKPNVRPATPRPFDIAFAPSEGLVTGARDLTLWLQATLKRDRRLLSRASYQAMMVPQAAADGPERYMGFGWQLRSEEGRDIAEHGGSVRGYNALVLTYPKERRGFVILTNADDAPRWEMARALDRALDASAA
jgi:CubicO group peptidase (beta-lactamase class C family)